MGLYLDNVETCVYVYFDEMDRLLYVGISNEPDVRHQRHLNEMKPWVMGSEYPLSQHRMQIVAWYPTPAEARANESKAIKAGGPRYNDHQSITRNWEFQWAVRNRLCNLDRDSLLYESNEIALYAPRAVSLDRHRSGWIEIAVEEFDSEGLYFKLRDGDPSITYGAYWDAFNYFRGRY